MEVFPKLLESTRLERLAPPEGRVRVVLDTDTYNEVDDQFAVTYAMLSPERIDVEAIYAAPFFNSRSEDPGDGMEKSYQEILRVLGKLGCNPEGFVFRGSDRYMPGPREPVPSEAVKDLIDKALNHKELLYVVILGTPSNVASALLTEPRIVNRIVVIWLGGHPYYWSSAREFNLRQDINASRLLFDSGVPLIHVPCKNVAEHLRTTVPELGAYLRGMSEIGDYLFRIFSDYQKEEFAWSKPLWDLAPVAFLVNPNWVPTEIAHSPILTYQLTYSLDRSRHLIRIATDTDRDAIFRDVFAKLRSA